MERIVCLAIGYAFGLFQTGYIYGRLQHIDIRDFGSGNAGTTNALRTLGPKAGLITFLGDLFKTIFAVVAARMIFGESHPDMLPLLGFYAGFGAVLGHNYPFYLKFRGGKGIAATGGIILSFNWVLALLGFLTFVITVAKTRYVSLGSLIMIGGFLVEMIIMGQMGYLGRMSQPHLYELYTIGAVLTGLAFYKHRANISRLRAGTENKLSFSRKK
ncbi:glycerol-3-phosphate 1-O-acyltransferase PlsY [Anaerobium acetethylicum]|uniref:Glycerol-3-phosphate acyltransferase n=1 Tax=Anaerobium acetethylicum TaxID=1619234 RepID=A0A1D3TPT5_9FIRM|nr:glycerol-3-phosphate 1-O-acyltransferase PlsY [Anaerobium acetethylicum]SCP95427.1 glycerol-3-phosphate acyltransferase PlsY [Anaerobium acetethylicum]